MGVYAEGLGDRLTDLHGRLHRGGAYRAPPVPGRNTQAGRWETTTRHRHEDCPKGGGTRSIYESEFLGFNYGAGRGAQTRLMAYAELNGVRVLDADVRAFFDNVNRDWLVRFLEYRIGDKRVIRLIPSG